MFVTADFLSYLLDIPTFNIIIQYLATILEDAKLYPTMLPDYSEIDYWKLGCGDYAGDPCAFIQPQSQPK